MKKLYFKIGSCKSLGNTFVFLLLSMTMFAQVGVNTTTPNATLDLKSTSEVNPTNTDGLLIPQIDNFPAVNPTVNQDGMLVFVTGNGTPTKGFYYWNNTLTNWVIMTNSGSVIGGNTLNQAYNQGGVGLGRTINASNGAVRINGEDGFLVTGDFGSGNTIDSEIIGDGTRMFFNPNKGAFRAGQIVAFLPTYGNEWDDVNIGVNSIALGLNTKASGQNSSAFGGFTTASGGNSTAFGSSSTASGGISTAFGSFTVASGSASTAFGVSSTASGDFSTVFGNGNTASQTYATAFGLASVASGVTATAFGNQTNATGFISTAFGSFTTASGTVATAFGLQTDASGQNATAFGDNTTASGDYSTAFGRLTVASEIRATAFGTNTTASGTVATAFGNNSEASGQNATAFGFSTLASGDQSTAFGTSSNASNYGTTAFGLATTASGYGSTAFGQQTLASAHTTTAFGFQSEASGMTATAFGRGTTASGDYSLAFGYNTSANASYTTAFGYQTFASHQSATTFGQYTSASGYASTAFGLGTNAFSSYETVVGCYNESYFPNQPNFGFNSQDRIFVVGNGIDNANRSNALTVYKSGLITINDAYNMPLTDGTINQVMTTNGAGVVSFQDVAGVTGNTLEDAYNQGGSGAGRIINTSNGPVEIRGRGGFIVETGAEPHMLFVDGLNNRIGVATNLPTADFSVNGLVNKPGGGTWAVFSDKRLKENITDYKEGLQLITKVRPVNFSYNAKMRALLGTNQIEKNKVYQGVIAQELQNIAPNMVREVSLGSKTFLEVDPNKFTYALINAVQEQQKEIESQKLKIEYLSTQVMKQQQELEAIKTLLTRQ